MTWELYVSRRGRPRPQPLLAPAIHYGLTNVQMCGRQAGRALRSPVQQRPRDSLISKVYKNTASLTPGLVIELLEYFLTQPRMSCWVLLKIHTHTFPGPCTFHRRRLWHASQVSRSTRTLLWCLLRETPILQPSFGSCRETCPHLIATWGRLWSFCDHLEFALLAEKQCVPWGGGACLQGSCWGICTPSFLHFLP